MRSHRFSIAGLMGVVLLAAIGLAALRTPSETWAGIVLLATLAALGIASVGAICVRGASRAGFLGFAVFGWIYMAAAFPPYGYWPKLPTRSLLEQLAPRIAGIEGPFPPPGGMGGMGGGMRSVGQGGGDAGGFRGPVTGTSLWLTAAEHFLQIGHCLFALLAASLGAVLSRWLFGAAIEKSEETTARSPAADEVRPRKWWVAPLVVRVIVPGRGLDRQRRLGPSSGALGRLDIPADLLSARAHGIRSRRSHEEGAARPGSAPPSSVWVS